MGKCVLSRQLSLLYQACNNAQVVYLSELQIFRICLRFFINYRGFFVQPNGRLVKLRWRPHVCLVDVEKNLMVTETLIFVEAIIYVKKIFFHRHFVHITYLTSHKFGSIARIFFQVLEQAFKICIRIYRWLDCANLIFLKYYFTWTGLARRNSE